MAEPFSDQGQTTSVDPTEPRRSGGTSLLWLLALPVLYVLSIGPVAKLNDAVNFPRNYPALGRALETIYTPLTWCATHSPAFARFIIWYAGVWHVKDYGR
jgi:hypothetical protein